MSWRVPEFEQKPAKNNDRASDKALSLGQRSFQIGASRQSCVLLLCKQAIAIALHIFLTVRHWLH